MAIKGIYWHPSQHGGHDIHLLPGHVSPRLDRLLVVDMGDGHRFLSDAPPPGSQWQVAFHTRFFPHPYPAVTVDPSTGEISVAAAVPPGPRLRSFIVTATVLQGGTHFRTDIRVYIHRTVEQRWLTPSSLTVRQDAKNMRFSVLARFDDGMVGDVSNWAAQPTNRVDGATYVHFPNSEDPVHTWAPGTTGGSMSVDKWTGEIYCLDAEGYLNVSLRDRSNAEVASALAFGASPWNTPVKVTPIAANGVAQMRSPGIRNVLFLPDGFADADRPTFEHYVRMIVTELTTNPLIKPFDILRDKLNYFFAWVPSPQAGGSVLQEHFTTTAANPLNGHLEATALEIPINPFNPDGPDSAPATLDLPQLFYTVGAPMPGLDQPGSPLGTDAAGRAHDWQELYGPLPSVTRTQAVYPEWLQRSTRILINECDTAFHVARESRPRVDERLTNANTMAFHPLRLTDEDFNIFLGALTDDKGVRLPPVWVERPPAGDSATHDPDQGKDHALVVILCRSNRFGGSNDPRGKVGARYVCVPLGVDFSHTVVRRGHEVDLVADPLPPAVDPHTWATVAHELAHSLTLGDEYGGDKRLPPAAVSGVQKYNNIQERAALLRQEPNPAGGTREVLVADSIKWLWPRLRQVGILRAPAANTPPVRPDPATAGGFLLSLAPGTAAVFASSRVPVDVVRLRKGKFAGADQFSPGGGSEKQHYSGQLRVITVDVANNQLTVAPVGGWRLNPADYRDGDQVVLPARGADPDPRNAQFGPDLLLVSQLVISRINDTHNPLNAAPGDASNVECVQPKAGLPTPATNFLVRPRNTRLSWQIVGLYDGGDGYDCGVYHSTGDCVMNLQDLDPIPVIKQFCPVCRYVLVELIDPVKHAEIDADYDRIYPA